MLGALPALRPPSGRPRRAARAARRAGAALAGALLVVACAPPDLGPAGGAGIGAGDAARAPTLGAPPPGASVDGAAAPAAGPTAPPDDSGWSMPRPGVERRRIVVRDAAGVARDRMMLLRLDPAALRFDVGYAPGAPRDLVGWQAETGALVVVNGGFFTESYDATGLVVSGGRTHGASYEAFGGMFAVTADGPEVRALGARPHDPAEPLVAALQAFPMLVASSAAAGFDDPAARPARRTWVGQDRAGRIVVGVAPEGGLTLRALADWLAASDLALDAALNLDGGASSGLLLAEPRELVPAFDVLPTVILAFEREG